MQPIRSKLGGLARKARDRMPSKARVMLDRLEGIYNARRAQADAASPPVVEETPAPPLVPQPAPINWELRSQAELVAHIEQHYHAGLRRDLPVLVEDARRIEREHAGHAAAPVGLADLLEVFAQELDAHMLKEERVLFPILRTGSRGGQVDMPIRMMERDHESHDDQLAEIAALTNNFRAPADASPVWTQLYKNLATLATELRQHIYLENNILFARATGGEY